MNVKLDSSWKRELENTFNEPYFLKLTTFVKEEYQKHVWNIRNMYAILQEIIYFQL